MRLAASDTDTDTTGTCHTLLVPLLQAACHNGHTRLDQATATMTLIHLQNTCLAV